MGSSRGASEVPDININLESSIQFDPATIPNGDLFSFLGFDASALANLDPAVLATGPDAVSGATDPNAAPPATPADPAAAAPQPPPAAPDPAAASPPADPSAPPPADPAAPPPAAPAAADPHILDLSAGAPGADPGLTALDDSVYIQPPPEGWLL